jgi:CRP-like cAMP-binding protein
VATSAVLTAVIGLAGQEALKDLFSGLELRLADDFGIGDWLELSDGRRGIVVGFSWRETRLRTIDDCLLLVPNSRITADVLTNRSCFGACCERFEVGLDYDFPPGRALPLLLQVVQQHPLVLADPPPAVRVKGFLDSAISYELQVWQKAVGERARLDLRSELLQQIWYSVHRHGQSFPFPVREIRPRRSALPPEQRQQPTLESCRLALASVPMFADLSEEERGLLVADSGLLTYGPGEAVVREGAEGHSLYCLLHGRVEVVKQLEDGRGVRVRELQAGSVFGEMTLFLDAPRSATVRTLEESQLLRVGRPAVRRLLEGNPALLERLAALVASRQAELEQLGNEQREEHSRGLLETMRRLFGVVSGGAGGE